MRKLLLLLLLISIKSLGQTLEEDRLALAAIYNNFSGQLYPELANWVVPGSPGDSPCGWYGVTCAGGRVTALDLKHLGIQGSLAPEVGNLTALTTLDLSGLGGELGAWTGELPLQVGNLTNLEYLYLSENRFGIANMGVIGSLTKLKGLALTLLGPIPSQFANLVNLEKLYLGADEAMGGGEMAPFPVFLTTLSKLKELYLIQQVEGVLPAEIGNLSNLEVLVLDRNFWMEPQLPAEIGNLSSLKRLKITGHNKVPDLGPIPFALGNLLNLEELEIGDSPFSGTLPAGFGNLTKLQKVVIGSTKLNGPLPGGISNFSDLTHLSLRFNAFSGSLPSLSNVPVSGYVDISSNAFTFAGMEENFGRLDSYANQAKIPMNVQFVPGGAKLSVQAGGTLTNNTYKWYKNNVLFATHVGDNSLVVTDEAAYRAEVSNSVVTGLTLLSNTYSFVKLPVTLVSFSGEKNGTQNRLIWKTSSETSNKGFEIERSADARTFEKIGFVDGNGDTKERNSYHFTDLMPPTTSYYRLKQLDYDGKSEYSKVIVVKAQQQQLSIYPNPAQNNITIAGYEGNLLVSVFSQTGKLVLQHKINTGHLPLESLKNGIYTIQIGNDSKKLLIQR